MQEEQDGKWYAHVPKDPIQNLRFRRYILAACKSDKKRQAAFREACRADILFYFNTFVWTYDPRLPNTAVPFITYKFQDDAIKEIYQSVLDGVPHLLQKGRDLGASWICCGVMDYMANFQRGKKFLMMSRVEDLVDKPGEPDSLFWKIDFIHKYLPSYIKPEVTRRKLTINYERSGSAVTGCSTTSAAGVGGRATAIFIDEFSRFEPRDAKLVMAGIADTSPCRIWNFTPFGMGHPSYELVTMAKRGDIRCTTMHWTKHPKKAAGLYTVDQKTGKVEIVDKSYQFPVDWEPMRDLKFLNHSPWFDKEYKERGYDNRTMSEMHEIDYMGSSYLFFDALRVHDMAIECGREPEVEGDLNYDQTSGEPKEFIRVKNGPIKLWFQLDAQGRPIVCAKNAGCDLATGQGASNSVISVANCETGEKLLEFATPSMLPTDFAIKCVAICRWLSTRRDPVFLCWECPGPGLSFGAKVMELKYSPVFWRRNEMSMSKAATDTPGWYSTRHNKRKLLEDFRASLYRSDFVNRSKAAFEEYLGWEMGPDGPVHQTTKNRTTDPTQAAVNHGDRTIADALCAMTLKDRGFSKKDLKPVTQPGSLQYWLDKDKAEEGQEFELYHDWSRNGI